MDMEGAQSYFRQGLLVNEDNVEQFIEDARPKSFFSA